MAIRDAVANKPERTGIGPETWGKLWDSVTLLGAKMRKELGLEEYEEELRRLISPLDDKLKIQASSTN